MGVDRFIKHRVCLLASDLSEQEVMVSAVTLYSVSYQQFVAVKIPPEV